jgi:pimeloyl-ACP methyl ester carboxylesterase
MAPVSWSRLTIDLEVDGVDVSIDTLHEAGLEPVLFLHGFGSTKEEYADFARFPGLARRGFVAFDAPGCGGSSCSRLDRVSIPFMVDVTCAVLDELAIDRIHVVGHSMGGLTAQLFAERTPHRVRTVTSIEGNLAPEDCFLSRQILTNPSDDPTTFLAEFAARTYVGAMFSSTVFGSRVLTTVDAGVIRPVFESLVDLSDSGGLLSRFIGLPMPLMFMYGEQNAHLSYLPELRRGGVSVVEVAHSGHWPMYSNPPAVWSALGAFLEMADRVA